MKRKVSILFIGNSFSDDMVWYMPYIAESLGINVDVRNLYYGGCEINRHIDFLKNDKPEYEYRYFENGEWKTRYGVTSRPIIRSKKWTYIVLQQASYLSGVKDGLKNLETLVYLIKENLIGKRTKFIWNMTWAYPKYSDLDVFKTSYKNNQIKMLNGIINNVNERIMFNPDFRIIIPTGIAIQHMRSLVDEHILHRDGFHLSYQPGRFLASLTAIKTIFDVDITKNTFIPQENMDDILYAKMIKVVKDLKNYKEK